MGMDQSILIYTFSRQSLFSGFQCNENTQESTLNLSFLYLKSCSSGKVTKRPARPMKKCVIYIELFSFVTITNWFT